MAVALRYLQLVLVSAPVLAFAWAYGGTRTEVLKLVMPWATLACALTTLLLPQRHPEEGWRAAERRVLGGMLRDPFLWTALALVLYLVLPLFNRALCPVCDWQAIDAGVSPFPRFRLLPFCCHPGEHATVLWWFVPALIGALGVRHGLSRTGKRIFYELLVWNAAALALLGVAQAVSGAQFPYWGKAPRSIQFFSVFSYPNMAGAYFVFHYALALGMWCLAMGRVENDPLDAPTAATRHPFLAMNYPVVAVALTFCGILGSLSRAAMVFCVVLTGLFCIYILLRAFSGNDWRRARRFRSAVTVFALLLAMGAATYVYAPPAAMRELRTLNANVLADRMSGKGQYHTRVAGAIMRDFPFYGVGGWGYRHFAPVYMTETELRHRQGEGGANVHNDYLQFLVEHGAVGFALIVACVWLLALPTARRWRQLTLKSLAAERSNMGASSMLLFAVQPSVLFIFFACVTVLIHAFGDCPLRSAAVLSSFFAVLPISFGFIPRDKELSDD